MKLTTIHETKKILKGCTSVMIDQLNDSPEACRYIYRLERMNVLECIGESNQYAVYRKVTF